MTVEEILIQIKREFESRADENRAVQMAQYMKNHFSFYGVNASTGKDIEKKMRHNWKSMDLETANQFVSLLWNEDNRELQYLALTVLRSKIKSLDSVHLSFVEELITTKSWWDTVDSLAPNVAGLIFLKEEVSKLDWFEKWNNSENMWLNRSAIIHQLRYKEKVNLDLLFATVDTHVDSKEFFIKKACGWGLRQASKFYPAEIKEFIESRPNLSNLTRREGSKYI